MLKYLPLICVVQIVNVIFQTSCAREGALPYQLPEFAPMYREECYADHKNWLCMDKDKDEISYPMGILFFMGHTIEN